MAVSCNLLAQLEDGQSNRDDEAEEGQLKGVPCLETEHTNGQWDQSHRLQQDKDHDGDDDFLQFGPSGFFDGSSLAELEVEAQLVVFDVSSADFDSSVERHFEGHVVGNKIILHGINE